MKTLEGSQLQILCLPLDQELLLQDRP
uniref:Uncharacterized protein n=1 Tax=Rhizophora mucronata TaxID=61149 RepID=A0A2P2MN78_RHIMU